MTRFLMTTLIAGALLAPAADAAVRGRQVRQAERIRQGIASGELTRPEARRLEHSRRSLNRSIRHDRVDGGGLTPRERGKIHRQQDHLSRRIYRQKHDRQRR